MNIIRIVALLVSLSPSVFAGDINWEGNYRFEATKIFNPSLADGGNNKAYILHQLTLRPQFQAYDGFTIHSRFDIFNNNNPVFANDQLGQAFGQGVNPTPGTAGTNSQNSNTTSDHQPTSMIGVKEFYANWVHEFGVLTVGRAPMHFGLGMTFNAGYGPFDHWLENRDLIAYKLVMGNFTVMPVLAKTYEGDLDQEDDVNDYILQLQYENPETDLEIGLIYQARRSTANANSNDTPNVPVGNGSTLVGNYEVNTYNVYVSQWVEAVKVAFEVGFMQGNMGLRTPTGQEIAQDAFGGVLELSYHPKGSHWGYNLDFGYATGDDPATDKYEGYIFDRNYDKAFILFNHPVGTQDFLRTAYLNNTSATAPAVNPSSSNSFDIEAISNTLYTSAAVHYKWAEKYDFETRLTYAQLNTEPFLNSNVDGNAGLEVDLSLKYLPFKGFQWINRAGIFMPGSAFSGGTNNYPTNNAFGFETKAAISF